MRIGCFKGWAMVVRGVVLSDFILCYYDCCLEFCVLIWVGFCFWVFLVGLVGVEFGLFLGCWFR